MKNYQSAFWGALFCMLFFVGCSKIKSLEDTGNEEYGIGITVDIGGISEEFETLASVPNSVQINNYASPDLTKLISFNDFDAIPSVQDLKPSISSKILIKDKNRLSASTPVNQGVKYYLLLFNDNNGSRGTFRNSYLLTAGQVTTIRIEPGKKYYWMAYSYNTNLDDLPTVTSSNLNVSMGENKDFLFAEGVTNIISATQPTFLSIIFNHMLSRVGIEINARGMFTDDIKALDTDLILSRFKITTPIIGNPREEDLPLKVANFNLLNKNITESSANYSNNTFKIFSFNKPEGDLPKSDSVLTYLYIPPYTNGEFRLNVRLNKLEIELDQEARVLENRSSRIFNYLDNPETSRPIIFSEDVSLLTSGKSVLLKVDLVESPLTINTRGRYELLGIPLIGFNYSVKWARSNLYFKPLDQSYRFQHANVQSNNSNSYFAWGSDRPFEYGKNSDPCLSVYPTGMWRMPNAADFYATIGGAVTDVNLLNILKVNLNLLGLSILGLDFPTPSSRNRTDKFVEYTPDAGNSSFYNSALGVDLNNKLRFNYNGFYLNIGLVENLIGLNLGDFGNVSRIWTSSANVGLLGPVAGVGAISYTGTLAMDYVDASPLNLLNIDLLGINVAKTDLLNIRCVRAQ